jgi:protein associated with RNAse G/E
VRNPVTVRKLKFDGSCKVEWDGDLVEAVGDEWAVVFHDSERYEIRDGIDRADQPHFYCLAYFNLLRPIAVLFSFDQRGELMSEAKCDAALPATLRRRRIEFVDLDLDVMVRRDLSHYLGDQKTFAEHAASMRYTDEVIAAAHEGVALAIELVERRALPFDGSAERLLGRVLASQGPL